jgi:hypothetical protein
LAGLMVGRTPEYLGKKIEAELNRLKDFSIGFKTDLSPCMFGLAGHLQFCFSLSPLVDLMVDFSIPPDLEFDIFRKGVDHGEIVGNTVFDIQGTHSNGISVYLENKDILMANNQVRDANSSMTYHGNNDPNLVVNLVIFNTF